MSDPKTPTAGEAQPLMAVPSTELLAAFYLEVKAALEASDAFDNFECFYGPKLGTCTNECCLECRVYRALKAANKELGANTGDRHE